MASHDNRNRTGNEPAPLLLLAVALVPLLGVAAWLIGWFGS